MQLIAFFDEILSKISVLDLGMGWARRALMAKAFGCDTYGVEISERRIEHAMSIGVNVLRGEDISHYSFDFTNAEQVFEHLPEPLRTLSRLSKVLKRNGLIKVSVPDCGDIRRRLRIMDWKAPRNSRNSLNPVAPLEHINCFNRKAIHLMAEKVGLEPFYLPLSLQFQFASGWGLSLGTAKNLLRPIYRNLLRRGTYIMLRKTSSPRVPE